MRMFSADVWRPLAFSEAESQLAERTKALETLTQQLLRVQDDERRRVARDLHDSTGQTLAALKLSVELLQRKLANNKVISGELSAIARLANDALQEIRTTSYLLHPPLLDEVGFTSAARWYVEGFALRSGIKTLIEFAPPAERLPNSIEIALFRVLQESLTNVHRDGALFYSPTATAAWCRRGTAEFGTSPKT